MFHFGLVDVVQADREREIAELIRVRRLLTPDPMVPATDAAKAGFAVSKTPRVRARAAGG